MAQAAAESARIEIGAAVRVREAAEAGPEDLLAAGGYLFATPENLAAMAGVMKDFFDRTYYPVFERIDGSVICA